MRLKAFLPVVIVSFSLAPSLGWAQKACAQLFRSALVVSEDAMQADKKMADKIMHFLELLGVGNTTSLRQEDKYVVTAQTVENNLNFLAHAHGEKFQLRDQKTEGRKNVTVTQYALPIKWKNAEGKNIAAKIRFRKYYDTDANLPLGQAEGRPADIVRDRQFVEFKIDHPDYGQVVVKPRMVVLDTDVDLLQSQTHFLKNKKAVLKRTLALNPRTPPKVIRLFFDIFADMYTENIAVLPQFAKTAYVRDSYSLMLKDRNDKSVEIQLTVDREVKVLDSRTQQVVSAYRPEDVVVELKTPLAYSQLTAENQAQVPGLNDVVTLKADLEKNHVDLYQLGSGKLSTFKKALEP
jgi:hypothetical protein